MVYLYVFVFLQVPLAGNCELAAELPIRKGMNEGNMVSTTATASVLCFLIDYFSDPGLHSE